jgi:hypothetical protein
VAVPQIAQIAGAPLMIEAVQVPNNCALTAMFFFSVLVRRSHARRFVFKQTACPIGRMSSIVLPEQAGEHGSKSKCNKEIL